MQVSVDRCWKEWDVHIIFLHVYSEDVLLGFAPGTWQVYLQTVVYAVNLKLKQQTQCNLE